jgi:hypothetical protein
MEAKKMMKFNLNDKIYFKLTSRGQKRFADPYFAACVNYDQERQLYACQMHAFCNLFGSGLMMGGNLDVETDIYFDIKKPEPPQLIAPKFNQFDVDDLKKRASALEAWKAKIEGNMKETRTKCAACHGTGIQQETSVGGHPQRCGICEGTGIKPVPCGHAPRVYPFGKI